MAKENLVMLRGIMITDIVVYQNDADESLAYCTGTLQVAKQERSVKSSEDKANLFFSEIRIASRDAAIINKLKDVKRGDIVGLRGVIGTLQQAKRTTCPHCGRMTTYIGQVLFVAPTFVEVLGRVKTNEEANRYLAECREISNIVKVFGILVRDPKQLNTQMGNKFTQYQLAVNRRMRASFDADPTNHADYPWVKSYGIAGQTDFERLMNKSEVYVDGFLQARKVLKHIVCGQKLDEKGKPIKDAYGNPVLLTDEEGNPMGCGQKYEAMEKTSEIVPYTTEYIGKYRSDEEVEEAARIRKEQSAKDLNSKARLTVDYDLSDDYDDEESVE